MAEQYKTASFQIQVESVSLRPRFGSHMGESENKYDYLLDLWYDATWVVVRDLEERLYKSYLVLSLYGIVHLL